MMSEGAHTKNHFQSFGQLLAFICLISMIDGHLESQCSQLENYKKILAKIDFVIRKI